MIGMLYSMDGRLMGCHGGPILTKQIRSTNEENLVRLKKYYY